MYSQEVIYTSGAASSCGVSTSLNAAPQCSERNHKVTPLPHPCRNSDRCACCSLLQGLRTSWGSPSTRFWACLGFLIACAHTQSRQ
jgi:hypothetical protein